ncbi:MAG TPA: murein L,D-transpeptidase family protein [Devosia sp.]|nr:murein L,D-transpeptidase family protein [Devosia sp.]
MTSSILRKLATIFVLFGVSLALAACGGLMKGDNRQNQPLNSGLVSAIKAIGSTPGQAMVVRIFKQESKLEVWKRTNAGQYRLLKSYDICAYSGDLGPKVREGDRQSPEGFYTITPGLMNPRSNYYLAFNTGFPNKFDRAWGRTGSDLMVHGDCSSRGCYAMTDEGISEIYALARETFKGGNPSFQLQIFPFRMTAANLAAHAADPNMSFWKNIKDGYDLFELNKAPPAWDVCERRYIFNFAAGGPLDAMGTCPIVTANAALLAKQQADEVAVASQLAARDRQAATEAALKARGAAVNSAVGGLFGGFGSLFGGKDENIAPVITGQPAPTPMPPLVRS